MSDLVGNQEDMFSRDAAHLNPCLGEAILMSTHNIGFYEEICKIITELYHQISSNTHLISSAGLMSSYCASEYIYIDIVWYKSIK